MTFRSSLLLPVSLSLWSFLMLSHRSAVRCPRAAHTAEWQEPQVFRTSSRPGPGGKMLAKLDWPAGFSAETAGVDCGCVAAACALAVSDVDLPHAASKHPPAITIARSLPRSVIGIDFLLRGCPLADLPL